MDYHVELNLVLAKHSRLHKETPVCKTSLHGQNCKWYDQGVHNSPLRTLTASPLVD